MEFLLTLLAVPLSVFLVLLIINKNIRKTFFDGLPARIIIGAYIIFIIWAIFQVDSSSNICGSGVTSYDC